MNKNQNLFYNYLDKRYTVTPLHRYNLETKAVRR